MEDNTITKHIWEYKSEEQMTPDSLLKGIRWDEENELGNRRRKGQWPIYVFFLKGSQPDMFISAWARKGLQLAHKTSWDENQLPDDLITTNADEKRNGVSWVVNADVDYYTGRRNAGKGGRKMYVVYTGKWNIN
jgi:hypothetical protein